MAIKFTDNSNLEFRNTWTQLKNSVIGKSLYNAADYEALTGPQKESYLLMLYQNNDALAERLPEEYYSEYGTTETRFGLLQALNMKYTQESLLADPEYNEKINQQVNEKFTDFMRGHAYNTLWANWVVDNEYGGDYSKFMADYSGDTASKTYEDLLTLMVPEEYELSEEKFKEDISAFDSKRNEIRSAYTEVGDEAYTNILQYAQQQIVHNRKRISLENASALEKTMNSIWQVPTLWVAESVEIVENIYDAVVGAASVISWATGVLGSETGEELANDLAEHAAYDWWAPDTWILSAVPNSYLSRYTDDNAAKWMHEIGVNIVDMAPMALNLVVPGLGTGAYYTAAAGKTFSSEIQQGYGIGEAFLYTTASTTIEYGTEKLSGNKIFGGGIFDKLEALGSKNLLTKIVHDTIGEGLEEVIAGIGTGIVHGVITGDYQLDGKDLLKAGLIGGIVGGIMAAGVDTVSNINAKRAAETGSVLFENLQGPAISSNGITVGPTLELSRHKAALLMDYIDRTKKRIDAGKKLSDKDTARYNVLKNLRVSPTNGRGYAAALVDSPVANETIKIEGGGSDDKDFAKKAAEWAKRAAEMPASDNSVYEFTEETGKTKTELGTLMANILSEEERKQAVEDHKLSLTVTLGKILSMFGEDMFVKGVKLFEQYINKTLDEIVALAQIGTEQSDLVLENEDTTSLSKHFIGANFKIVKPKATTELNKRLNELNSAMKVLRGVLASTKNNGGFRSNDEIKLFITDGDTVATTFFVDHTLYVNAHWLADTDIGRVKDIITCKYCAENARRIVDKTKSADSANALLLEMIQKIDNPNRSTEVMLQEIAFIMMFQKNNIMMQQFMAYNPDKSKSNMLVKYFSALRTKVANTAVQYASGAALENIQTCCETLFEVDKPNETLPAQRNTDMETLLNEYREHEFRVFPFITGKNGVNRNLAKINAMYTHFKNVYGFNKQLDLTKRINWIKQLSDPKNYDGDGFARLTAEIEKYRPVKSSSGYTMDTVPANKTIGELLNYYIDQTCGLMVFSNGVITETEFTTAILNMPKIDALAKSLPSLTDSADRRRVGKVSDFFTQYGNDKLSASMQEVPIYVTFDSVNNKTFGYTLGTPDSGMAIVINIANAKTLSEQEVTIGGKSLLLDNNGEIKRDAEGNFEVDDYTQTVSKLATVIGHEIGHVIGMTMDFTGTLCETDLANIYTRQLLLMSAEERTKFVDSIKSWLFDGEQIKPSLIKFAYSFEDVSKEDVLNNTETAHEKINEFVDKLSGITDKSSDDAVYKAVLPLAKYLYYTGITNEMFANGDPSFVAREDALRVQLQQAKNKSSGTAIVTNSDLYFIQVLNGRFVRGPGSRYIHRALLSELDSPENAIRRVYHKADSLPQLKQDLKVEFDKDLINPDYWASRSKPNSKKHTRSELIDAFENAFDCTYDNVQQEFKGGYVSKYVRNDDTLPRQNESYSVAIFDDGQIIDTRNTAAFSNNSNVNTFIAYRPRKGKKAAHLTIQMNGNIPRVAMNIANMIYGWIDKSEVTFIAGGRQFANISAARKYISSNSTASSNADFETLFKSVTGAATKGLRHNYAKDTIYMTTDGTVYNINMTMQDWLNAAKVLGIDTAFLDGQFEDTPEKISPALSRLLDEKQVLRLYRSGNTWVAYGLPNQTQDDFVRAMRAERKSQVPYISITPDRELFVASKRETLDVEIHGLNWSNPDFKPVSWRKDLWYKSICQIAAKYDLRSIQDFETLGFSQAFIDALGSLNGITKETVKAYLLDGSNTIISKNILIENSPEIRADRKLESGDWKNNPYIHNMLDAEKYWQLVCVYGPVLKDDTIYSNILDLQKALEKARNDPANVSIINARIKESEDMYKLLGSDIYMQILNKASVTPLTLDRASFEYIYNYMRSWVKSARHRLSRETNLEMEDEDGHSRLKGESLETPDEFDNIASAPSDSIIDRLTEDIEDIKSVSDEELRNSRFSDLLEMFDDPEYADYENLEYAKDLIHTAMTGESMTQYQKKSLTSIKERVERYNKMEDDSPEKLAERRRLIRYYEQISHGKLDVVSEQGGAYYKSLRDLLRPVGAYRMNINAKFANIFKRAKNEYLSRGYVSEREYSAYENMYEQFKLVDMEYPGWYTNLESFYQLMYDRFHNKPNTQGKSFKSVYTDIGNFLNQYEADAEFRQKIANREKVADYILSKNVKGARLFESDLKRFNDIPEDVKDISRFSKDAIALYEQLRNGDPEILASILADADSVSDLLKLYGQDYIYNLKKLYNRLIMPALGSGISKAKADIVSKILAKAKADETSVKAVMSTITRGRTSTELSTARESFRRERLINYRQFALSYAARLRDYLSGGNPITDEQRAAALNELSEKLQDFQWPVDQKRRVIKLDLFELDESKRDAAIIDIRRNFSAYNPEVRKDRGTPRYVEISTTHSEKSDSFKKLMTRYLRFFDRKNFSVEERKYLVYKDLYHLPRGKAYRVVTALLDAYYSFMDNPKTDRSIEKFKVDTAVALNDQKINATVPGDKKKHFVTIQVPERYQLSLKDGGEKLTKEDIDKRLKPIFDKVIAEPNANRQNEIDKFREQLVAEEEILDAFDDPDVVPTIGQSLAKDIATRKQQLTRYAGVKSSDDYRYEDVSYENGWFHYPSSDTPLRAVPLPYRMDKIPEAMWRQYINDQVDKGVAKGELVITDKGVLDAKLNKIVISNRYLQYEEDSTEDNIPDEDDFEEQDDTPSEDDFEDSDISSGISKFELDMDLDFAPLDVQETDTTQPKGSWSEVQNNVSTDLKTGLSANIQTMLNYVPSKSDASGFTWNNHEFISDNSGYLAKFTNSVSEMEAFVSKIESGPSVSINSPQEAIIFSLLNQVDNSVNAPAELQRRANNLLKQLAARAGRTLGMIKSTGVTPVDQLVGLCSKFLNLTNDEKVILSNAADGHKAAIDAGDYTAANDMIQGVLNIVRKHKSELPVSMNIFDKNLTPEERTTRWHNITERVTSWRYFAMLGSPTTFFTKNIASDVIITGMNKTAEWIASFLPGGKNLSKNYDFTDKLFDGKVSNNISVETVAAILDRLITDKNDRAAISAESLTAYLNSFIKTRYKVQNRLPSAQAISNKANEYLRKNFYQYKLNGTVNDKVKSVVKQKLVDNGLLDGLMNDQISKYDRGYDAKIGSLRKLVLSEETDFSDLSEAEASLLSDAINKDAPFGNPNNIFNVYYRFIFRTMEAGDRAFIKPKIIKVVEKLVASNMTADEIAKLETGDKSARAKLNDFIQFALNDTMKTYFRDNSELQQKIMRLFNGNPIPQLIFSTLVPFPRMLLNTMGTALSYSPIGFIKAAIIAHNDQTLFTNIRVNKEIGKAITGTVLIAIGAALAACGWLAFDEDDEYGGVQVVIGNTVRIALNDFMPSASPLIIGATMADKYTEGIWSMVYNGGNALLDATLLGEAVEIFGGNKTSADVAVDTFSSFVNQFVPSIMRHAARIVDPTQKKYSSNKGIKIMQRIIASIPFASKYLVPTKVDPYTGKAQYQNTGSNEPWAHVLAFVNAFAPAKITVDLESDVERESKDVGAATTGPAKTYTIDGVQYTIPDDLYRDYQILRAKLYSQYAKNIINTTAYQKMTIAQKKAKLSRLQSKATEEARKQLNIGK